MTDENLIKVMRINVISGVPLKSVIFHLKQKSHWHNIIMCLNCLCSFVQYPDQYLQRNPLIKKELLRTAHILC